MILKNLKWLNYNIVGKFVESFRTRKNQKMFDLCSTRDIKLLYMASVKVVLRKKENKEGKYPLCIQIIKDRKSSIIHLGQHIKVEDWDESK